MLFNDVNLTAIFESSKVFKNICFKYSRVTYQKTRIGTLNLNIGSIFINIDWLAKNRAFLKNVQPFNCL